MFGHDVSTYHLLFTLINTRDNASVQQDAAIELTLHNARELFGNSPVRSALSFSSDVLRDAQVRAVAP